MQAKVALRACDAAISKFVSKNEVQTPVTHSSYIVISKSVKGHIGLERFELKSAMMAYRPVFATMVLMHFFFGLIR